MTKLTSDAKFEDSDKKASIAALSFVFSSAAKHSVDGIMNSYQKVGTLIPLQVEQWDVRGLYMPCILHGDSLVSMSYIHIIIVTKNSLTQEVDLQPHNNCTYTHKYNYIYIPMSSRL